MSLLAQWASFAIADPVRSSSPRSAVHADDAIMRAAAFAAATNCSAAPAAATGISAGRVAARSPTRRRNRHQSGAVSHPRRLAPPNRRLQPRPGQPCRGHPCRETRA